MTEYIKRLKNYGYKTLEAARIYECFKRYLSLKYLNEILDDMESEGYVADVQSESLR